jgi:hypothetical protein
MELALNITADYVRLRTKRKDFDIKCRGYHRKIIQGKACRKIEEIATSTNTTIFSPFSLLSRNSEDRTLEKRAAEEVDVSSEWLLGYVEKTSLLLLGLVATIVAI